MTGACLELVDRALPYGPVVQALRQAVRTMSPADFDAVVGPARAELAHLLPELRPDGERPAGERPAGEIAHEGGLLEHLLGVVERLGADAPVLFVIEDLHWADRSTRDLLVFLAQPAGHAGRARRHLPQRRSAPPPPAARGARRARARRHGAAHRARALHARRAAGPARRPSSSRSRRSSSSTPSSNDRRATRSSRRK